MNFRIRAAGSLGNPADLGKKAYRLRCRFRVGALPGPRILEKAKYAAAERFVHDMHTQGWEYVDRFGFRMAGPYPAVDAITVHQVRQPTTRQMLAGGLMQGNRFRPNGGTVAPTVLPLAENEKWEYELAGVFVHNAIVAEVPD